MIEQTMPASAQFQTASLTAGLPAGVHLPPQPAIDLRRLADERLRRLRSALDRAHCDALVLTAPESVHYATGYRSMPSQVFRTHQMAAVVTGDDLWLICSAADAPAAAAAGMPVDRLMTFGRFFVEHLGDQTQLTALTQVSNRNADLPAALSQVVDQLPATITYGLESPTTHGALAAVLESHGAHDCTDTVVDARAVKSAAEVELLRYSAHLSEVAVQAALESARPGTTERELAAVIASTMVAGGGDPRFVVATTGPRSALADVVPSDRPWQIGETARFDIGCLVEGYWSDIGRTAVLGAPDDRQRAVFAATNAGIAAQLERAAPGVAARELFAAGLAGTGEQVAAYRRQHCGHGIGLSIYEPPVLTPEDETILRPGMTFCFETPYYELGWGGMMVEDAVLITESGVELLSGTGRGLTVVPV